MDRGAAVVYQNIVYCISDFSNTVYQYLLDEDEWQEHSHCPHSRTGLAIIKDLLTAVGGYRSGDKTNKLVTWRGGRWEEVFPPMNTARCNHAVLTDSSYVIAAGGDGETSVEIFNMSSNSWSTVTSLPQPLPFITATLSHNVLYAMDCDGRTFSISMSHWTENTSREPPRPPPRWQRLPQPLPVRWSSLASLSGAVVAVGGRRGLTTTGDVYQLYNSEWVRIGCMDTAREWPIVLALPGEMLVVGGYSPSSPSSPYSTLTAVELAVLC